MMLAGNSPVGTELHKGFRPLAGVSVPHGERSDKRARYKPLSLLNADWPSIWLSGMN